MTAMKMRKLLFTVIAALAIATPAHAGEISFRPEFLGQWCQVENKDRWMTFERKNQCQGNASLILKQNGDYVWADEILRVNCKAIPKSFFKGWTDYSCTLNGKPQKTTNQKFLIDVDTGKLSLAY